MMEWESTMQIGKKTTFENTVVGLRFLFPCLYLRPRFACRSNDNKIQLHFASCLMMLKTLITLRLTDKHYCFGDTLAITGQVTTDREFLSHSRTSVYSRIWKLPVIFFGHCPCTVHSTCQANTARPMPFGIAYFIGKTTLRSSYQPTTCEQLYKKHNIVTCLYKTSRLLQ